MCRHLFVLSTVAHFFFVILHFLGFTFEEPKDID